MSLEVERIEPLWSNSKIMMSSIESLLYSKFTPDSIVRKLELCRSHCRCLDRSIYPGSRTRVRCMFSVLRLSIAGLILDL